MSSSYPNFSRKNSSGAFKSAIQFAKKALKSEIDGAPIFFSPTRFKEIIKMWIADRAMRIEEKRNRGIVAFNLYPTI